MLPADCSKDHGDVKLRGTVFICSEGPSLALRNINANHDIRYGIQIVSSKSLPSSKSFYGQVLQPDHVTSEASFTAFRSSRFNEPPFQLKVLQSSDGNL